MGDRLPANARLLKDALESLRQVDRSLQLARESRLDMTEACERLEAARATLLALIDRLCDLHRQAVARKD